MTRIAALLLITIIVSPPAFAQEFSNSAGASAMLSSRSSDPICTQGSGCSQPVESGVAWGLGFEFRRQLTSAVRVGVEVSLPQEIETLQHTGIPNAQYDVTHRDVFFSGIMAFHTRRASIAQLALVGGASLIAERFSVSTTSAPFGSSAYPPFGDSVSTTHWALGLVGGADLDLAVTRRVSIVPELRVHWILNGEGGEGVALGLGSVVWRPALGLRARF